LVAAEAGSLENNQAADYSVVGLLVVDFLPLDLF